jgi:predicted amidophosphoribosyltransferase
MFAQSKERLQGQDIIVLGAYRPWTHHKDMGGDSSNYPRHSGRILDLKENRAQGINYFYDYMQPKLKSPEAIAVVPSHDPEKGPGGLHALAAKLAANCGMEDASAALVRHTRIEKLANGGDRSLQVHANSIHIPNVALVEGKAVLLIDDVMTSGNSLLACRQLLVDAGASAVKCVALGRTTY